jgi:hypothetical protein
MNDWGPFDLKKTFKFTENNLTFELVLGENFLIFWIFDSQLGKKYNFHRICETNRFRQM